MKKLFLCTASLLVSLLSQSTFAEVNVAVHSKGAVGEVGYNPSQTLIASNEQAVSASGTPVDQALSWRWDGEARRDVLQSFRTGDKEMSFDRITFRTGGANLSKIFKENANIRFRLTIYRLPSATAFPTASGSELVGEQIGSFAGFADGYEVRHGMIQNTSHTYITFSFDPVKLEPDSYYAVVLSFMQGGQGQAIPLGMNADNVVTYKQGTGGLLEEGGVWKPCHDFYFYAEGKPSGE